MSHLNPSESERGQLLVTKYADTWSRAGERFLSTLWHAYRPGGLELLAQHRMEPTFTLTARHFADAAQWAVCLALVAHYELDKVPTVSTLRDVADSVGYESDTGDKFDLIRRLATVEVSPAGINKFGMMLVGFERQARLYEQIRTLIPALVDPHEPVDTTVGKLGEALEHWKAGGPLPTPPRRKRIIGTVYKKPATKRRKGCAA